MSTEKVFFSGLVVDDIALVVVVVWCLCHILVSSVSFFGYVDVLQHFPFMLHTSFLLFLQEIVSLLLVFIYVHYVDDADVVLFFLGHRCGTGICG